MTDVILYFDWNTYRPDQRQYRQQSVELTPNVCDGLSHTKVAMSIPLEHYLIHNSEAVIQAQLAGDKGIEPVLTLAGMKYVIDKFDLLFKEEEKKAETKDDEDWGDDLPPATATKPGETAAADSEDWDNDDKKPEEVPWDESKEEWN